MLLGSIVMIFSSLLLTLMVLYKNILILSFSSFLKNCSLAHFTTHVGNSITRLITHLAKLFIFFFVCLFV